MEFNYQTHFRNKKTGQVERVEPYRMVVEKVEGRGAQTFIEKPVGSGLWHRPKTVKRPGHDDITMLELDKERSREGVAKREAAEAVAAERARVAALSAQELHELELEKARKLLASENAGKADEAAKAIAASQAEVEKLKAELKAERAKAATVPVVPVAPEAPAAGRRNS